MAFVRWMESRVTARLTITVGRSRKNWIGPGSPTLRGFPPSTGCPRGQKPRSVGLPGPIQFFRDRPTVIVSRAVTRLSIHRTNAMSVLRDFQCRPVEFRQGGNQPGDHAGLADAAGVSADNDKGHKAVVGRWSLVV